MDHDCFLSSGIQSVLNERYKYSRYIIDPNKYRFRKVLRILALVTLLAAIANSINNMPIAVGNKVDSVENLDLITPNRLLLGRNNDRCPSKPLNVTSDYSRIIETNVNIFKIWFKYWLISCVPLLINRTKWFKSDKNLEIGDVVLFLKSDKEFDQQYQYGLVKEIHKSRDGHVRKADIEYQNHNENVKRNTSRGARELVVILPYEEQGTYEMLGTASKCNHVITDSGHVSRCFNDLNTT